MTWDYDFWITGQPASSKNQRRIVKFGGITRLIKSEKALAYSASFNKQCPVADNLITGDVALWVDAYYASRRPDLACLDLVQDLLQGKIYANDRQVKACCSIWNLDKENPRVRIRVRNLPLPASIETYSLEDCSIWD